jgi:membrane protease YdiL (CAAX protease family)
VNALRRFLTRHAVAAYFVLTFAISWGGVFLAIGGWPGFSAVQAQDHPLFPLVVVAMLAGPGLASLTLTTLVYGRQGLRALRTRLLDWRAGASWHAVAVLAAPLVALTVAAALSRVSTELMPGFLVASDTTRLVLLGMTVGLVAGVFEEIGWTGFAIPHLRRRHGVLATGLVVGVLWSAWHIPVVAWGMGDRAGSIPLPAFIVIDGLASLPAFRVLMVWVYDRTQSLPVAIVMHASLTATTLILAPQITGFLLLAYGLTFAGAVWATLAVLAMGSRYSRRQPARDRTPWPGVQRRSA